MKPGLLHLAILFIAGAAVACAGGRQDKAERTALRAPVLVRGGVFRMGSENGKPDERPAHEVRVSDFYIMPTEVTQKEYAALMGANPSSPIRGMGDDYPVNRVSFYDAAAFANKLSERDGLKPCYAINGTGAACDWSANGWRLPTEAEWEYAARGGTLSRGCACAGSDDASAVAWVFTPAAHPVGTKAPNELGLYDMSGNVWEWVWDVYAPYPSASQNDPRGPAAGTAFADRGGGWSAGADAARPANRGVDNDRGHRDGDLGFRLVRSASSPLARGKGNHR